jgi:2-oxoglutarate ferredoxin oxidoreductase subunit delta
MSKRFEVRVLARFCKGCGLCVEFCEQGKLYIRAEPNKQGIQTAAVRPDVECTGCMKCAVICPDAAVELTHIQQTVTSDASAQ